VFHGELRRQKALFAASDTLAVAAAVGTARLLRDPLVLWSPLHPNGHTEIATTLIVILVAWVMSARAVGLYELSKRGPGEILAIAKAGCAAMLVFLIFCFMTREEPSRLAVGLTLVFSVIFAAASRIVLRRLIMRFYASPGISIPIVIVGRCAIAKYVRDRIVQELSQYNFLGFIAESGAATNGAGEGQLLGGLEQIPRLAAAYPNLEAALLLSDCAAERAQEIVELCEHHKVQWRLMPAQFSSLVRPLTVDMIGVVPLIGPRNSNVEGLNYLIKRTFDVVVVSLLLVLFAPVLLIALLAVWLFDGRPLLFRQTRVGVHGKQFELIKFRTMKTASSDAAHREFVKGWIGQQGNGGNSHNGQSNGANSHNGNQVFKMSADPRITRVGKWLRRFSIDELPQLINVLRGEMSLIGPRPALPYELELYQDWHRHRLDAPPGITGLWQVSGRNRLAFDQMVALDIQYIEDWSFGGDLRILLRTLPVLLQGSGY
jgi:exopolysaccharide biosynthesis polyprenyl glycosylphosphotransferase